MIGSPRTRESAGMMSWPGSPRMRIRPMGPGAPMRKCGWPRSTLAGGASVRSGRWPSRVWMTSSPRRRAAASTAWQGSTAAASRDTSVPRASPNPPGSRKSRCMAMMISAVRSRSPAIGSGSASIKTVMAWPASNKGESGDRSPDPVLSHAVAGGLTQKSGAPGPRRRAGVTPRTYSEPEAEAGERHQHVAVGGGERTRGSGEGLGQQQAVVDQVIVLNARVDVPLAQPRRHPSERDRPLEAGREHALIAGRARGEDGRAAAGDAAIPVGRWPDAGPGRRREYQRRTLFGEVERRRHAELDVVGVALVADHHVGIAGGGPPQPHVGIDGDRQHANTLVAVFERELRVRFRVKVIRRAEELDERRAERPIPGEHHVGADEPVELVPGADERLALFAPQVVPGADGERDLVDEAVRVLVKVEHEARQRLRGKTGV